MVVLLQILLFIPAMAAPAEKIPVTATQTVGSAVGGTERWVSHDNILHNKEQLEEERLPFTFLIRTLF